MFKSIFGFKKKPSLSIFPNTASASVSSLALLLVTMGPPFSEWKPDDLDLTEEEQGGVHLACNCLQLFMYPTQFKKTILGEVLMGCALTIAKDERPELADFMHKGYSVIENAFSAAALAYGVEDASESKLLSFVASTWVETFEVNLTETESRTRAEKIYQCFLYAKDRASAIFQPMVTAIDTFDLDEIYQLDFYEHNLSIFERALQNREKFKFLYRGFEPPTAKEQYEAKLKELEAAKSLEAEFEASIETMVAKLGNIEAKDACDLIRDWFWVSQDTLAALKTVQGERCMIAGLSVRQEQERMVEMLKPLLTECLGQGADINEMIESWRDATVKTGISAKVATLAKNIPSDELPNYLLSLGPDYFDSLKLYKFKEPMTRFVESIGGLDSFSEDEAAYITERLELFPE